MALIDAFSYLLCLICFHQNQGATFQESTELYRELLDKSVRHVRPLVDQNRYLNVEVKLSLKTLNSFDEVRGVLTTMSVLDMTWRDENIGWVYSEHNGTSHVYLPIHSVWTPRLVLTNAADRLREIDDVSAYVRYDQDGVALWHSGDIFITTCKADLLYYPYDIQSCRLTFVSSAYSACEVLLLSGTNGFDASYIEENGFWNSIRTSSEDFVIQNKSFVSFTVTFDRKPLFLVINILLPILILCVLNLFVFLLPAGSGERTSYAMTVLLSLAVFMTIVSDNLPKVSKPVPLITYYLLSLVTYSACIAATNIMSLCIYHRHESDHVPWYLSPLIRYSTKISNATDYCDGKITGTNASMTATCDQIELDSENESLKRDVPRDVDVETVHVKINWNNIGKLLDKICCFVFVLVLVLETIVFQLHFQSRG